jgi:hypothetical protein
MAVRVPVGKSYKDAAFVVLVVFAVLFTGLAVIVAIATRSAVGAGVVGGIAGLFTLLAVARGCVIARNRRWLSPTDTGFVLTDRRGDFEFTDEMVSDLATWAKTVYSNGLAKSRRRTGSFVITAGESAVTFAFEYTFPINRPDPLGAMIDRVFNKLVEKARADVLRGREIAGDGWALDKTELAFVRGREDVHLPVREVSAVDLTEGKVCVWRKGEAEAVLRIPAGTPNALVMGRVLQDLKPPGDTEGEPADGLGRIIFERNQSIKGAGRIAAGCGILVLFLLGTLIAVAGIAGGGGMIAFWVGLALVLGGIAGAVAVWNRRVKVFRCHAYGVARTTPKGVTKLLYKDIGSFTYSGVRQYVNGGYAGTTVNLRFEPLDEGRGEPLVYSATIKNSDDALDNLREFISRVVAGHMLRRLQAGQAVRWTKSLTFLPDGLSVGKGGWAKGRGGAGVIPYNRLRNFDITDGVFRLATGTGTEWVVEEPVSQPNFFPGFTLLMLILYPPQEARPAAAAEPNPGV